MLIIFLLIRIANRNFVSFLDVDGGWGKERPLNCVCVEGTNATRTIRKTCDSPTPGSQGNICPCEDAIEYESCDGLVSTRTESCADEPCSGNS